MQSLVMDVNAALVIYRNNFMAARAARDTALCEVAISCANSLLKDDFKLIFDTQAHEATGHITYSLKCAKCGKEIKLSKDLIKYEAIDSIMGSTVFKFVDCPKKTCKAKTEVIEKNLTENIDDHLDSVYVPEKPKANSIFDRVYNYGAYWTWIDKTWALLESQHQKLRASISNDDYVADAGPTL